MTVVAGAILIVLASGARERVAAAVYAVSLAGLFGTSALYHAGRGRSGSALFCGGSTTR